MFLEYQLAAVFGSIALARSVCLVLPGSSACGSKCARCAVCLWVKSVCIHSCLSGSFFVPVRIFFVPSACCPCSRDGSACACLILAVVLCRIGTRKPGAKLGKFCHTLQKHYSRCSHPMDAWLGAIVVLTSCPWTRRFANCRPAATFR